MKHSAGKKRVWPLLFLLIGCEACKKSPPDVVPDVPSSSGAGGTLQASAAGSAGSGGSSAAGSSAGGSGGQTSSGAAGSAGGSGGAGAGGAAGCPDGLFLCQGACAKATDPACVGPLVTFGPVVNSNPLFVPPGSATSYWKVEIEDMDGDGIVDVVMALEFEKGGQAGVVIVRGLLGGTFDSTPMFLEMFPGPGGPVVTGDVNGDGRRDLVYRTGQHPYKLMLNQGGGKFAPPPSGGTGDLSCPFMADLNGDGLQDMLCLTFDQNNLTGVRPLLSVGDGTFSPGPDTPTSDLGQPAVRLRHPEIGREALVFGDIDRATQYSLPTPKAPGLLQKLPGNIGGTVFFAADVLQKGKPQLVFTQGNVVLYDLAADGKTATTAAVVDVQANGALSYATEAADMNGDGLPDLVVTGDLVGVQVYQQLRDHTFMLTFSGLKQAEAPAVDPQKALADVNGDGLPDLIFYGAFAVYPNTTPKAP